MTSLAGQCHAKFLPRGQTCYTPCYTLAKVTRARPRSVCVVPGRYSGKAKDLECKPSYRCVPYVIVKRTKSEASIVGTQPEDTTRKNDPSHWVPLPLRVWFWVPLVILLVLGGIGLELALHFSKKNNGTCCIRSIVTIIC